MRSLDHIAKETIEMKIAGPDRTAIEVPQLNITASESHTACTKFVEPDKVAESASIRTHSNEPETKNPSQGITRYLYVFRFNIQTQTLTRLHTHVKTAEK